MNKILRIHILVFLVLMLSVSVWAQDISFTSAVGQNPLVLGESTQLRLQITGTQDVSPIKLPNIDGLEIRYVGPSRQVSMVNGDVSKSITFTYSLVPAKTGVFTIPGLRLTIDGADYITNPIALEVVDGGDQSSGADTVRLEDRIFLEMELLKKKAYVNEGIPVKFTFYVSGIDVRQVSLPEFDVPGFIMEPFSQRPNQSQIVKNGLRFNVVEFDTVIYPTRVGELPVEPAQLNVSVSMPSDRNNRASGLFSDAFFEHFFTNQTRTFTLRSNGDVVQVNPLPEKNQPENFSNAVGEFDFSVNVSPTDVNAGDPLTITARLKGEGNLKAIEMPRFKESEDFRSYEPIIKEENGIKTLEQVLIPKSHTVKEVPALTLSYFDPKSEDYKEKVQGPFPVNVRKAPTGGGISVAGFDSGASGTSATPETFGEDIVFIKDHIGQISKRGHYMHVNPIFIVLGVFLAGVYAVLFWIFARNARLHNDTGYAKRFKAKKRIKKELSALHDLTRKAKPEQFYDELVHTLQHFVADVMGISVGIVTSGEIEYREEFKKLDQALRIMIKDILVESDQVRFASADIDQAQMKASLVKFEQIIKRLEHYET